LILQKHVLKRENHWMEFINRQQIYEHAVSHVSDTIMLNQELFLAQIIKMNPEINLLNYRVCYKPIECEDGFGKSFWLEEIKSTF